MHSELLFLVRLFWRNLELDKSKDCVWVIAAGVPWAAVLFCSVLCSMWPWQWVSMGTGSCGNQHWNNGVKPWSVSKCPFMQVFIAVIQTHHFNLEAGPFLASFVWKKICSPLGLNQVCISKMPIFMHVWEPGRLITDACAPSQEDICSSWCRHMPPLCNLWAHPVSVTSITRRFLPEVSSLWCWLLWLVTPVKSRFRWSVPFQSRLGGNCRLPPIGIISGLFGFSPQEVKISKTYLFLPAGKLGNKLPKKVFCRVSEVMVPYQSYRMGDLLLNMVGVCREGKCCCL